jgi:GTP:adenosylcobinamide-phosphate guanylyltransferase
MKPTGYSYRVDLNVWAGEYPVWDWDESIGRKQIHLFTDFGINYFIDLTEGCEMPPYAPFLSLPLDITSYQSQIEELLLR